MTQDSGTAALLHAGDILNADHFLVKEEAGLLKAAIAFDLLDPQTGRRLLECREGALSPQLRLARNVFRKRSTPFELFVRDPAGVTVMRLARKLPVFDARVRVYDEHGDPLGGFIEKPFSISGTFDVVDTNGHTVCKLQGGLTGWSYRFLAPGDVELARVTKQWAGLGQELFTRADDYRLEIDAAVPRNSAVRRLILASALCVGILAKGELP